MCDSSGLGDARGKHKRPINTGVAVLRRPVLDVPGLCYNRTKAALAAYKARGGVLEAARPGAYRLTGGANAKAAKRAGEVATARAVDAYADLAPAIAAMRADEGLSLRAIAGRLNIEGHTTRRGEIWNQVQVGRVLEKQFGTE